MIEYVCGQQPVGNSRETMRSLFSLAFPLLLIGYAIWQLRGVWRIAAIGCFVVVLPVSVMDMQGAARGGNLAGIYTTMLAKPLLAFLLILWLTRVVVNNSKHLNNVTIKYTAAALSSILLVGGVLYLSSVFPLVPLGGRLLGQLSAVPFWLLGGLVGLTLAIFTFRASVQPPTTEQPTQPSMAQRRSPAARCALATLSSVAHLVGVVYLLMWSAPVLFPQMSQTGRWIHFAVACLMALVAAVYSFRAIMKRQKSIESNYG